MSGKETVHYMHFMNWTNQVPGTFIGDHGGPTQIKEILQGTLKQCTMHDWMVSSDKTYKGGFHLLDLIIPEIKSHMICYNPMPLIG